MAFVALCVFLLAIVGVHGDVLSPTGPISDPCNSTAFTGDPFIFWEGSRGTAMCDLEAGTAEDGNTGNHYLALFPGGNTAIMQLGHMRHYHAMTTELVVLPLALQFTGGFNSLTPDPTNYTNNPDIEYNVHMVYHGQEGGDGATCKGDMLYGHTAPYLYQRDHGLQTHVPYNDWQTRTKKFTVGTGLSFRLSLDNNDLVLHTQLSTKTLDSNTLVDDVEGLLIHENRVNNVVMSEVRFNTTGMPVGNHVLTFTVEFEIDTRWRQEKVLTAGSVRACHFYLDVFGRVRILAKTNLWANDRTAGNPLVSESDILVLATPMIYPNHDPTSAFGYNTGDFVDQLRAIAFPHMVCTPLAQPVGSLVRAGVETEIFLQITYPYNYTVLGEWKAIVVGPVTLGLWHPASEDLLFVRNDDPTTEQYEYGPQTAVLIIQIQQMDAVEAVINEIITDYADVTCAHYDCLYPCIYRMTTDTIIAGLCGSDSTGDWRHSLLDREIAIYFVLQGEINGGYYPGTANVTQTAAANLIAAPHPVYPVAYTGFPNTDRLYLLLSAKQVCDVLAASDAALRDSGGSFVAENNLAMNIYMSYSMCEPIERSCLGDFSDARYDFCGLCVTNDTECCSFHGISTSTQCICDPGYCGDRCQYVESACGTCGGVSRACCNNAGTAILNPPLTVPPYTCTCDPGSGWSGTYCETRTCGPFASLDPTVANLCVCDDEKCAGAPDNGTFGFYTCPSLIDLCGVCRGVHRSCCSDHGVTSTPVPNVTCGCDAGYCGSLCELTIDECSVCGGDSRSCCNEHGVMQATGECYCDGVYCGPGCLLTHNRCEQCLLHYYFKGIPADRIAQEDGSVIVRAQPATFEVNSTLLQCSRSSMAVAMADSTAGRLVARTGVVTETAATTSIEFGLGVLSSTTYDFHIALPGGGVWTRHIPPVAVSGTYIHMEFNYTAIFAPTHEHLADDRESVYTDIYTVQFRSPVSTPSVWVLAGDSASSQTALDDEESVHILLIQDQGTTDPSIWIQLVDQALGWPSFQDTEAGTAGDVDTTSFWYTISLKSLWDEIRKDAITSATVVSDTLLDDASTYLGIPTFVWTIGGSVLAASSIGMLAFIWL